MFCENHHIFQVIVTSEKTGGRRYIPTRVGDHSFDFDIPLNSGTNIYVKTLCD
jgi:hypothetical protein